MACWEDDLIATTERRGMLGAIVAWFLNPGFVVICRYRLSHWLRKKGRIGWGLGSFVRARTMRRYGCEISPDAEIGAGLRLCHPIGIIIGDGVRIGRNVTIYQNVTLGRPQHKVHQYPTVNDDVTIYAGAVIVGGVTVGRGAVIAANAVVTKDIPPGAVYGGIPAKRLSMA